MSKTRTVVYTSGTHDLSTLNLPSDVIIQLAGTNPNLQPLQPYVTDSAAPPSTPVTVGMVEVLGTSRTPNYGTVEPIETPFTIQNGLVVQHGTLVTDTNIGMTLDGNSQVTDSGTLTVLGGRYQASTFMLNGTIAVGTNSTANFSDAHLSGNGTVKTTAPSATIDARAVGDATNADTFDLTEGGTLNLYNGIGTGSIFFIHMGANATINLNTIGAAPAVSEVIQHGVVTTTLELFDAAGDSVGQLGFPKNTPTLYVQATTNHMPAPFNYQPASVQITTHWAAGDLPISIPPPITPEPTRHA